MPVTPPPLLRADLPRMAQAPACTPAEPLGSGGAPGSGWPQPDDGAALLSDAPLHIVLNPGSGRPDSADCIATLRQVLDAAGRRYELHALRHPRELARAGRRAVDAARASGGAVVAAGGDGTVNALAALVLPTGLPFGVLPQGTFNYVARAHGIPTDTEAALQGLLNARIQPVRVGLVNGRPFLVNASMGLYARALDDREEIKGRLGRSRPVAMLAGLLTVLRPHRNWVIQLEVDGQATTVVTPTLFVGNNALQLQQLGLDAAAQPGEDQLMAIMTAPMSRMQILGLLLRGAAGRLAEAEAVTCLPFHTLTLSPRLPRKPRRLKVATDGETTFMQTPLRFTVAPQRLQLLVPA